MGISTALYRLPWTARTALASYSTHFPWGVLAEFWRIRVGIQATWLTRSSNGIKCKNRKKLCMIFYEVNVVHTKSKQKETIDCRSTSSAANAVYSSSPVLPLSSCIRPLSAATKFYPPWDVADYPKFKLVDERGRYLHVTCVWKKDCWQFHTGIS